MKLLKKIKLQPENWDNKFLHWLRYCEIKYPVRFFGFIMAFIMMFFVFINYSILASDQLRNTTNETDQSFIFNIILAFIIAEIFYFIRLMRNPNTGFPGYNLKI